MYLYIHPACVLGACSRSLCFFLYKSVKYLSGFNFFSSNSLHTLFSLWSVLALASFLPMKYNSNSFFPISLHPSTLHRSFTLKGSSLGVNFIPTMLSKSLKCTWYSFRLTSNPIGSFGTIKVAMAKGCERLFSTIITLNKWVGTATLLSPINWKIKYAHCKIKKYKYKLPYIIYFSNLNPFQTCFFTRHTSFEQIDLKMFSSLSSKGTSQTLWRKFIQIKKTVLFK